MELSSHSKLPRLDLGVDWGSPWQEFRSSLRSHFSGERAPQDAELPADSDLRVEWIQGRFPGRAFTAAALWHVAAIAIILLPIWHFLASNPPNLAPVRIELTWTNPTQDLPPISLPGHEIKPSPKGDPAKPLPRKGADAFHPRQTILSEPIRVTHPRQTLIQPDAPATPPKIDNPLPNIAEWASTPAIPKPQLHLGSAAAAPEIRHRAAADLTAPEVNQEKNAGPLDIAASPMIERATAHARRTHIQSGCSEAHHASRYRRCPGSFFRLRRRRESAPPDCDFGIARTSSAGSERAARKSRRACCDFT